MGDSTWRRLNSRSDEIGMTVKETRAVSFAVETVAGEEIGGYYVGLADTEYLVSTFGDGAGNIDFDAVAPGHD